MLKNIPLYIKILIGMTLGLAWGLFSLSQGLDETITLFYLKPLGDIFTSLLKMVAVPLIISSLVVGVAGLGDTSKLSKLGSKTIVLYLFTTAVAISVGLFVGNVFSPGEGLSTETKDLLLKTFSDQALETQKKAKETFSEGPLAPLVKMIPSNVFGSFSNNRAMLQVVFFTLMFGICLVMIEKEKSKPVLSFFDGVNAVILKMIDLVMLVAPIGVFGLVAGVVVKLPNVEILYALLKYSACVVGGLSLMLFVVYPGMLYFFTKKNIWEFFKAIRPAQLLAFSTSSSSATLPVTMEVCQDRLGIKNEVSSFVLPLGATINMDGTSLYQAVATIFIAQVFGIELDFAAQASIIFLALLTSIGAAGVPGAGMILLAVVLEANHIPVEGIALILAVDRILDMCRTMVNVTGDATVAFIVNHKTKD